MHKALVLISLLFFFFSTAAQPAIRDESNNVYKIYEAQVSTLLNSRGMGSSEIERLLGMYKANEISSDEEFAARLSGLYPANKGIAILFYFFHNDSLRRVLFEPGTIREKKTIAVTKEQLSQLSTDFNYAMGLYKQAETMMPTQRGLIVKQKPASEGLTYPSLIKRATLLLLPEHFDERYRHLIIIPALNIGTIPFQLLEPYGDNSSLVDKCSFAIVPSLIDLFGLRIRTLKNAGIWRGTLDGNFEDNYSSPGFLDTAFFSFNYTLFVSNPSYPSNTAYSFPDLPGAKKEIDSAKNQVNKYVLLEGDNAVKDTVIKYLKISDLAYFATHGIADEEQPLEKSFLVLSGDAPFLTAKDIMDLRHIPGPKDRGSKVTDEGIVTADNAYFPEMVILSACQTGLGKSVDAGIIGLARSFLLAGANHVIMSLWNVDDQATAFLMNRFLFHLREPHPFTPSEPLRLAMLDARKRFPEPSQWAGFSLFGTAY